MAEQREFGNRFSLQSRDNDKLEHYRIQIQKLRQQNAQQQQAYLKKIAYLQKLVKQVQHGNSSSADWDQQSTRYQPPTVTHVQILKRDKEINRLVQQNQKLRKQVNVNPDHELLLKKRGFFDEIADKDAKINRLERTIYQLQSRYDGKNFNDMRVKNEFEILEAQNKKLRKQLQQASSNLKNQNVVSTQILDSIRYKKQLELLTKQNQLLRNQYLKVNEEYQTFAGNMQGKLNSGAEIDVLKRDLRESNKRNQQLINYAKELESRNASLLSQIRLSNRPNQNDQRNPEYRLSSNVGQSGSKKKKRIFQQKQSSPSAFIAENNKDIQQSTYIRKTNENQMTIQEQERIQNQRKHLQEQEQKMRQHQKFLDERQKRRNLELQALENENKQKNQNKGQFNNQNLPATARKQGGYYDRFGLNRITSRVSGESNISK